MPAAAASYFDRPPPAPRPLRIANLLSVFLLFVLLAGGLGIARLAGSPHISRWFAPAATTPFLPGHRPPPMLLPATRRVAPRPLAGVVLGRRAMGLAAEQGPGAAATAASCARGCGRVVGITGTLGAGKGTIVDLLTKEENYTHYSVRAFLVDRLQAQGLPVNRDTMTELANGLRAAHHPAYIVEQLHAAASAAGGDCVIESIRTVGEVAALRHRGNFYLLAVDAAPEVRYERAVRRGSETDGVSYETFLADERREMSNTDPNKQNLAACMALADFRFDNSGTTAELFQRVREALATLPWPPAPSHPPPP